MSTAPLEIGKSNFWFRISPLDGNCLKISWIYFLAHAVPSSKGINWVRKVSKTKFWTQFATWWSIHALNYFFFFSLKSDVFWPQRKLELHCLWIISFTFCILVDRWQIQTWTSWRGKDFWVFWNPSTVITWCIVALETSGAAKATKLWVCSLFSKSKFFETKFGS